VIILSVRPSDWHQIEVNADGKLVISVMAGIPLSAICEQLRTSRVVRALPNAAAEVRKSYTAWTATAGTTDDDRTVVRDIFSTCGVQDEVQTEAQIDYLTGLTGSGPAFPALLAKAMMDDAVLHGLDRDMARRAVNTLIIGAGRLLERHDECPGDTVQAFLDYRGTTAAAIDEMRKAGFDSAVARGLTAALEKSVSMGAAS
jgi:pyrroline-5-carboxylate reductase